MLQTPDYKRAATLPGVLNEVVNRWSPRSFADKPVENDKLERCFEAARWAASCKNEQPWRFLLGRKGDDTYARIFETLVEFNQNWCKLAPVLVLTVGQDFFSSNHQPNEPFYTYDVGQAAANFALQAYHEGLQLHQMGGFSAAKARELFAIPEGYHPLTTWALGYVAEPEQLPEGYYREQELLARKRKPLSEFVFNGEWGKPLTF